VLESFTGLELSLAVVQILLSSMGHYQGAEKSLLQAAQKDPEARRLSGNEAYGSFSAAC
jgi:hypothetical protein